MVKYQRKDFTCVTKNIQDSGSILKKTQAFLSKVFRKYDKNNTFIMANLYPKISATGRKELPVLSVGEKC